jgi:hypothetical protein
LASLLPPLTTPVVDAGPVDLCGSPPTQTWSSFEDNNGSRFSSGTSITFRFERATGMAMKGYRTQSKPDYLQEYDAQLALDAQEIFIPRPERRVI